MTNSTNGISRRAAPKSTMRVGLGTARAARAAGFEVAATHPAEHARFASTVFPTRRARGNSGVTGYSISLYKQCLQALVNYFQDALVNGKVEASAQSFLRSGNSAATIAV